MNPETEKWLQEVRARHGRLCVDIKEALALASTPAECAYENTINDLLNDLRRFDALVTEQAEEIERVQRLADAISLEKYELVTKLESLRSEANRAEFNVLTEVLSDEETGDLETNETMFNRGAKHAVEVVERKRDEWQVSVEFSQASKEPFQSFVAAANEILAELKGD